MKWTREKAGTMAINNDDDVIYRGVEVILDEDVNDNEVFLKVPRDEWISDEPSQYFIEFVYWDEAKRRKCTWFVPKEDVESIVVYDVLRKEDQDTSIPY